MINYHYYSVSLLPLIKGDAIKARTMIHHATKTGQEYSIRVGDWKWIPGTGELFNIRTDPEEYHNLRFLRPGKAQELDILLQEKLNSVRERSRRTKNGSLKDQC